MCRERDDYHAVLLDPYRVAYFSGFWYLIGNEPATGAMKRYALDRIADFRLSRNTFKGIPKNVDAILQGSTNIWFREEQNLEVKVLVDAECAHYFKRRKMFPTQEIQQEKADGSLIISYRMGCYEAIVGVIKSWIPHMVILEPEELKKNFSSEMKGWLKQQEIVI